jgi:hypothetical protein
LLILLIVISLAAPPDEYAPVMVRMNFRGETGTQSSIMPTLVAFMKIWHRPSMLTNHLAGMRSLRSLQKARPLVSKIQAIDGFISMNHFQNQTRLQPGEF